MAAHNPGSAAFTLCSGCKVKMLAWGTSIVYINRGGYKALHNPMEFGGP